MSWAYACKLEAQLRNEVEELIKRAESENGRAEQEINIPAELQRREVRLAKIKDVKTELELRAAERYAQEQTEYNAKLKEREEKQQSTGRKPGGKPPKAPEAGPRTKDQANFTDGDFRIMPTASGFEQAYNAQASVDMPTMLILGQHIQTASLPCALMILSLLIFREESIMKPNVGGIDRALRIGAGLVLIGLAIAGIGTPWTWIGVMPLATGIFKFCPVYPLLGMNSCPMDQK